MHTLLHIGAGYSTELNDWLDLGFEKVILVEPNPELAEQLRDKTAQLSNVNVLELAISEDVELNTLHTYNLPQADSLRPIAGLKKLYPGLKCLSSYQVTTESIVAVVTRLVPNAQPENMLVIQAAGESGTVIKALAENQLLTRFSHISITDTYIAGYENSMSSDDTLALLTDQGYDFTQSSTDDPDWPKWEMSLNPAVVKLMASDSNLQKNVIANTDTINQLKAELEAQAKAAQSLDSLVKQLAQEKENLALNKEGLETLLAEAQQSAKAKQEKITALETQLSETQNSSAACNKIINKLKSDLDTQTKQKQSISDKIKSLEAELAEAQKSATTSKDVINKLKSDLEVITKEKQTISEKSTQLAEEKDELNTHFLNCKKQAEEGEAKIQSLNEANTTLKEENTALTKRSNELKKQLEEAQQKIQLLETQLNAGKETQHTLSALQKQMEYLFEQNRLQLEQATNALGQHITHTGKKTAYDLQTFVQCQQTLGQSTQVLNYKDQSLGPEFALYLNQKLTSNHYDVILVLGSGVITQFVASQLQQGLNVHKRLSHYHNSSEEGFIELDQGDLPKRLLSFEHKKSDSKELKKHLQEQGLYSWVNVSHAPLIDCHFGGKNYLYYDIRKQLSHLSVVYEDRHARILTLVCYHQNNENINQEALLPALLQELGSHQLEIVSSLAANQVDKMQSMWASVLEARDIENTINHDNQIGVLSLHVNTN